MNKLEHIVLMSTGTDKPIFGTSRNGVKRNYTIHNEKREIRVMTLFNYLNMALDIKPIISVFGFSVAVFYDGNTIRKKQAEEYRVAVWNDDEASPDEGIFNIVTKYPTLQVAKAGWSHDNVIIYKHKNGDYMKVSYGRYDPDLNAMVWSDTLLD